MPVRSHVPGHRSLSFASPKSKGGISATLKLHALVTPQSKTHGVVSYLRTPSGSGSDQSSDEVDKDLFRSFAKGVPHHMFPAVHARPFVRLYRGWGYSWINLLWARHLLSMFVDELAKPESCWPGTESLIDHRSVFLWNSWNAF